MKFICLNILLLLIWLNAVDGINHSILYQNLYRLHQIRQNVASSNTAVQLVFPNYNEVAKRSFEHLTTPMNTASIFCRSDSDCKKITSSSVCLIVSSDEPGVCISKQPGTSMMHSKNILYIFVLFCLLLIIDWILRYTFDWTKICFCLSLF